MFFIFLLFIVGTCVFYALQISYNTNELNNYPALKRLAFMKGDNSNMMKDILTRINYIYKNTQAVRVKYYDSELSALFIKYKQLAEQTLQDPNLLPTQLFLINNYNTYKDVEEIGTETDVVYTGQQILQRQLALMYKAIKAKSIDQYGLSLITFMIKNYPLISI